MQPMLIPSMIAGASLIALTYIYGAIRAREWSWKIIFICVFLMSAIWILQIAFFFFRMPRSWSLNSVAFASLCVSVLLQTVIMIAVTASLVIDWRRNTPRHWLHYFGIGLLALSSLKFLLQVSPEVAKLPIFR